MKPAACLVLALVVSACGGSSTSPSPTPITPLTYTITGTVVATNGAQPLGGLSVDLNGQPATTNGAGGFAYTLTGGTNSRLTLAGAGIVPRALTLNVGAARTVSIDAIALGGGFDLGFYRQFVRNGFEAPAALQPVRRWTRNLNVWMQTGSDAATRTMVEAVLREAIPQWTTGRFTLGAVEHGSGSNGGQAGWITVRFPSDSGHCGRTDAIGTEGNTIDLFTNPACACNGWTTRPTTVRHEIGHVLGFYHTDSAVDVMVSASGVCDKPISARELAHAAIAYARPVGNVDPDSDPVGVVSLAPMRVR